MILAGLHNIHSRNQYRLADSQHGYATKDVERFWSKVNRDGEGGCWLWTLSVMDRYGHGQFTVRGGAAQRHLYAHRVAWELTNGPIPDGLSVLHSCDVGRCVNPAHLFLGTQADNLNDARAKGRLVDGLSARKLSDAAYRDILNSSRAYGEGRRLMQKYGVSKTTISRIWHGRQGSTYHNRPKTPFDAVLERVPSRQLPIRGEVR